LAVISTAYLPKSATADLTFLPVADDDQLPNQEFGVIDTKDCARHG
jgi:hypothetical protein